jgi:hypothetical protein
MMSPMRMRAAALVAGWLAALGVATAVGWAGVSLVGDEVAPSGSTPLSQAEVERRIHAASGSASGTVPGTGSVRGSGPVTSPSGTSTSVGPSVNATAVQRSVVVEGGTVVLECVGDRIGAKSSPRAGYTVSQELNASGTEVEITFDDGSRRSRVDGACRGGTPTATEHEMDNGQDD